MIPFNKPTFLGDELEYIKEAIVSKAHISGDGFFTKESNKILEQYLAAQKSLLTHSCTAALEMSAILLDLKEGDEVICPSYTFVTSITSFVLRGAKPVFVDIKADTLNIDEEKISAAITKNTKAICVVHYAGISCNMDAIRKIAKDEEISIGI